jgi:hypothetical protein
VVQNPKNVWSDVLFTILTKFLEKNVHSLIFVMLSYEEITT